MKQPHRPKIPPPAARRNQYDVTDSVRISHPDEVCRAVSRIFERCYPGIALRPLERSFQTFTRLYAGLLPGYLGCDTWYHDAQHSLDCTLAMARLIDGHERAVPAHQRLGARRAMLGLISALFHDAGYIRRRQDGARNGAEYTLSHVHRSGEFLKSFLPGIGFAAEAELASRMLHFTGYEVALDRIDVADPQDRTLGFLLGTADVLAQTSDRCYLEKCRDFLYREFEICGLAGSARPGQAQPYYGSVEDLLYKTPEFNHKLWQERLDGYFGGVYRHLETHFGGRDPYIGNIQLNLERVRAMIAQRSFKALKLRPRAIAARELRHLVAPERAHGRAAVPRKRPLRLAQAY